MKNNKLIGDFMDIQSTGLSVYKESAYKYHSSWDWLMPVVQKCYKTESHYVPFDNLVDAVSTLDLGGTYEAVVWFIQEYNLTPKEVV